MNAEAYEIRWDAYRYALANSFLDDLRRSMRRGRLSATDYKLLKARALSGDIKGAARELAEIEGESYDR